MIFIPLILAHLLGDFLLQTEDMAMNKSKDNRALLKHVAVYSSVFFIFGIPYFNNILGTIAFVLLTFVCHFITDYFTSRWTSKLYAERKYYGFPAFFSVIGLDQTLHYLQLFITYKLLIG